MFSMRAIFLAALVAIALAACSKDPQKAKVEYFLSGEQFVRDGKLSEGIIQFRNALKQDPQYGEARLALAHALRKSGDASSAYREYLHAAETLPTNVRVQIEAGWIRLAAGEFQESRTLAERAIAQESRNVEAHILLGSALAGLKQFDAAVAEVEAAIALDSTRAESYDALAFVHVTRGSMTKAEAAFKRAVQLAPGQPEPIVALANFHIAMGQLAKAESVLSGSIKADPHNISLNRALAAAYVSSGKLRKAEAPLKLIVDQTKTPAAMIALADYYRISRRYDDAMRVLERTESTDAEAFVASTTRKAAILRAQGRSAESYAALDQALTRQPKNVGASALKLQYQLADGKKEEALATAEQLAKENPDAFQAIHVLGRALQGNGRGPEAIEAYMRALKLQPGDVATRVELSRLLLATGKPDDALKHARRAVDLAPDDPNAILTLTRIQIATGNLAAAETALNMLATRHGGISAVHAQLGMLHVLRKDSQAARASFNRALKLDAGAIEAISGLANLDLEAKNVSAARARLASALANNPSSPRLLMLAAHVDALSGHPEKAEIHLRHVLELDPGNIAAYAALARIYMSRGRLDAAIAEYEKASARSPKDIGPLTLVAMLLELQQKTHEAQKRYQQVLEIEPGAPVAANNLAWILAQTGEDLDRAMQLALTAKSALPESGEVADTLGWIYYKKGLYAKAVTALQVAVAKQPANADFSYHLGFAHAQNGDHSLARDRLETALKANPASPLAGQARSELERLSRTARL